MNQRPFGYWPNPMTTEPCTAYPMKGETKHWIDETKQNEIQVHIFQKFLIIVEHSPVLYFIILHMCKTHTVADCAVTACRALENGVFFRN